jgi:hypothetical protein
MSHWLQPCQVLCTIVSLQAVRGYCCYYQPTNLTGCAGCSLALTEVRPGLPAAWQEGNMRA